MNVKRFVWSCIAVYVVGLVLGILINGILLGATWESLVGDVMRSEEDMSSVGWISFLTFAVSAVMFCYIFTRGYEGRGPMEGVRYGLLIGFWFGIVMNYQVYVNFPIPASLAHSLFIAGLFNSCVCGLVLALIYKPAEAPAVEAEL